MPFLSQKIKRESSLFQYINNKSYKENPYISVEDLRYVTVSYYDFNNVIQKGHLIVNKAIEDDTLFIFKKFFESKYQLNSVKLVEKFWDTDNLNTDKASMRNNNCSCFNYRIVDGSNRLSNHALGLAIDINPIQNPYIINRKGTLDFSDLSKVELYYANNRNKSISHVITHDDLAYKLFIERGFEWGGDWNYDTRSIDYQHFQKVVFG